MRRVWLLMSGVLVFFGTHGGNLVAQDCPQLIHSEELATYDQAPNSAVKAAGELLLTTHKDGVRIYNISDPTNPVFESTFLTPRSVPDVEVSGNLLYLASGRGLSIVDLSNPSSPVRIGEALTDYPLTDVAYTGTTAYVTNRFTGLQVIDVSDPQHPTHRR